MKKKVIILSIVIVILCLVFITFYEPIELGGEVTQQNENIEKNNQRIHLLEELNKQYNNDKNKS